MSRNLNPSAGAHQNYGATSSTSNMASNLSAEAFSPTEFMSLSENIAQNISGVNSTCMQLQKTLKAIESPKTVRQENQNKVHNLNTKTNKRIEQITKDLQRLTAIVMRSDKQQKLQLEKLTKDFQSVIEKYYIVQQEVATAMKQAYFPKGAASTQLQDFLQQESDQAYLLQSQQHVNESLQFEQSMLEDRERQIKEIEEDMLDVNAIMQRVGEILHAQGESVGRIETNIETSAIEVERAQSELAKAAAHRQSHRRKMIIILLIAVIVGLTVTGIIIGKIRN